jgi:hypothetical protein
MSRHFPKFDVEADRLYDLNPVELPCLSFLCERPRSADAIDREARLTP